MPFIAVCRNCRYIEWGKNLKEIDYATESHDFKHHEDKQPKWDQFSIAQYEFSILESGDKQARHELLQRLKREYYPSSEGDRKITGEESTSRPIKIGENREEFLDFMERLLLDEKKEEKRKAFSDNVESQIVDLSEDTITVECRFPKFEEGDVVGYITMENHVEPLGGVMVGGDIVTVSLVKPLELKEGQNLTLCESEVLVGYDLQLELVKRIKSGELNDMEKTAVSTVFEKLNWHKPDKNITSDLKDVRDGFPLDGSQSDAVESILGMKKGEILLIIGPPGTGKTRVIAKATLELAKKGERVLITSHTNIAVDNAVEILPLEITLRVGRPEKVLPQLRDRLLSYKARTVLGREFADLENAIKFKKNEIRIHNQRLKNLDEEIEKGTASDFVIRSKNDIKMKLNQTKAILKKLYEERNRMLIEENRRLIKQARIIGATLIKSQLPPLADERFDAVLIDECSQASITLALLGMVKGQKWVLVGDHKQLLPIFKTLIGYHQDKLSAFCYMLEKYGERALWLRHHYRSNNAIIGFSQKFIYEGNIIPDERCKDIMLSLKSRPEKMPYLCGEKPIVFLHVDGVEIVEKGGSRRNDSEAEILAKIVTALKNLGVEEHDIGVITPYRAQRDHVKELLKNREIEVSTENGIEVNTVDSFQGREKDAIVFSITSTRDMSFVEDPNKLNVAFTRAKKKLIVIGNAESINRCPGLLSKFISYVREREGYFYVPDSPKKSINGES